MKSFFLRKGRKKRSFSPGSWRGLALGGHLTVHGSRRQSKLCSRHPLSHSSLPTLSDPSSPACLCWEGRARPCWLRCALHSEPLEEWQGGGGASWHLAGLVRPAEGDRTGSALNTKTFFCSGLRPDKIFSDSTENVKPKHSAYLRMHALYVMHISVHG